MPSMLIDVTSVYSWHDQSKPSDLQRPRLGLRKPSALGVDERSARVPVWRRHEVRVQRLRRHWPKRRVAECERDTRETPAR